MLSLHSLKRELSSVGSEHLPYKQRVTGSNPVAPTDQNPATKVVGFFHFPKRQARLSVLENEKTRRMLVRRF